jgi:hypothetical protein
MKLESGSNTKLRRSTFDVRRLKFLSFNNSQLIDLEKYQTSNDELRLMKIVNPNPKPIWFKISV